MLRLLLVAAASLAAEEFPSAQIQSSTITAKFYLPDSQRGYYRGTRFDWSGVIYSLRTKNHEYFGKWFPKYDPKLHDAIMGPVEEFRSGAVALGYDEAKAGGTFIRIGIGVLRKPEEAKFEAFKTYEILDHGKWKIKRGANSIAFTHQLKDGAGYAYHYTKTIRLDADKPVMTIEHVLRNTGQKRIQTSQYNHNFFVIDGQPTGPATHVQTAFELKPVRPFTENNAINRGNEVIYTKELGEGDRAFAEFAGFGKTASDYDFRLENRNAGAGVHITGDVPLSKLVYWSIRTVFSPEPYVDLDVAPGAETKWTYRYEFYDLPAASKTK